MSDKSQTDLKTFIETVHRKDEKRNGNINQSVSYEAIRNYVNGIGDSNPLYRDKEYAKTTSYGALIALPIGFIASFPPG